MSKPRSKWSLCIDKVEANARPRMFFDTAKETNALCTRGDPEDNWVYVMYESKEECDDAFYAFCDYFRTARKKISPFDYDDK